MNNPIFIFDNIGSNFVVENNNFIILGALEGYQTLEDNHVGYYIPYLARCIGSQKPLWELGIGYVQKNNGKIYVNRVEITSSSEKSNERVYFESCEGTKQFFVFLNSKQFNTGLNNVILKNTDFDVLSVNATYIVDASSGLIHANLPDAKDNKNLEIRFRLLNEGRLHILENKQNIKTLTGNYNFTSFISDGNSWVELDNSHEILQNFSVQSENNFSIQSATDSAIPYYSGSAGDLLSSTVFWGNNNKLLLGSSVESEAFSVLPTSGSYPTVINNTKTNSDFIVYGSGYNSNLYFSKDGRLGLNMPTGTDGVTTKTPITLLHLVNTLCRDAIRIDNRSDCHPASINLYHRPSTNENIVDDREISKLVMSSVTKDSVYTPFANIVGKAKSTTPGSSKGQLQVNVNSGSSSNTVTTIDTSPDQTNIGYPNSNVNIGTSSIQLNSSAIALNGNISISGNIATASTSNISMNGTTLASGGNVTLNSLYINDSNIATNQLLAIDANKKLYAATGISFGLAANKLVTTDSNGALVGVSNISDFLKSGPDITWNKYSSRSANVCLRQVSFIDSPTIEEFSVGDQIAMMDSSGNYVYRYVDTLVANGSNIASLILDQELPQTATTQVSVFSISKGGYLHNQVVLSSDGGQADSTYITLSTRPGQDTVFNGNRKNINFTVYSTDDSPSLRVLSNASTKQAAQGQYFKYATQIRLEDNFQPDPSPVVFNSDLDLPANTSQQNSVTYGASSVSKQSTGKSSYYGTFDQNGNAFEWIENKQALQNNKIESWQLGTQFICGGSWKTDSSEKLRSIIPESYDVKKPDIGFRICSRYGQTENVGSLGLSFSTVSDISNAPDVGPLYREGSSDRYSAAPEIDPEVNFINVPNLGRVNYLYNISSYEITNSQYVQFLQNIDPSGQNADEYYVTSNDYANNSKGIIVQNDQYVLSDNKFSSAPVVYISYLNAVRFINWLHNGAPAYQAIVNEATETNETINNVISRKISSGAYAVNIVNGNVSIQKNKDQKYWLPSLNEWHKAAYYRPAILLAEEATSAVIIKTDAPKELSSGNLAALTVGGGLYAENLVVGTYGESADNVLKTSVDILDNYTVVLGNQNIVTVPPTQIGAGTYGTYISNTGIVLAANGTIKIITSNDVDSNIFEINPTGIVVPKLTIGTGSTKTVIEGGNITKVETTTTNTGESTSIAVQQYDGPASGIIYKYVEVNDNQELIIDAKSADGITVVPNSSSVILKSAANGEIVYADENTGYLEGNSDIRYTKIGVDSLGPLVSGALVFNTGQAIDVPLIRIGPVLDSYKGRILTHNGGGVAEWGPADFLRADGITYNRFKKRAVLFGYDNVEKNISKNTVKFTDLSSAKGGTGPIEVTVTINGEERTLSGIEAIKHEFATADTIAIYSPKNNVHYAKVRTTIFQGGDLLDTASDVNNASFFSDEDSLTIIFGPPVPWDADEVLLQSGDETYYVGYAFAIQKGSYLDMDIEPKAKFGFDDEGRNDESYRRFKPSTANTLSIRPTIHTSFNKVAEDIDFAIYGYRSTLYNRYESWFNRDDSGLPTGLDPAFYVHAKLENSFEGSIASGIYKSSIITPKSADGVILDNEVYANNVKIDMTPKVCINTKQPYAITSISNVFKGKIYGNQEDEIKYGLQLLPSGFMASGTKPLSKYADLTVSGYIYGNNIIADDIYLNYDRSVTNNPKYIPNAPLSINRFGKLISIVPPAPPTPPGKPSGFVASPGRDGINLYWQAPLDDGRSTIFAYEIQYSTDGNVWWDFKNDTIKSDLFAFVPLCDPAAPDAEKALNEQEGVCIVGGSYTYQFRIRAVNFEGNGDWSTPILNIKASSTVASAPRLIEFDRNIEPEDIITTVEDFVNVKRTSNPTLLLDTPVNLGTALSSYVIDYAKTHELDPITQLLVPLKQLAWESPAIIIGDDTETTNDSRYGIIDKTRITEKLTFQDILSDYIYTIRVRPLHTNGSYGTALIIKTVGTLAEPIIEEPTTEEEDWDFGVVLFNGGCQ